jgi:hypothetical protein
MRNKPILIIGVLMIVLGVAALAVRRISYSTDEQSIQVGPAKATIETKRVIELPPLLSGFVLAGGVLLVVLGWFDSHRAKQ